MFNMNQMCKTTCIQDKVISLEDWLSWLSNQSSYVLAFANQLITEVHGNLVRTILFYSNALNHPINNRITSYRGNFQYRRTCSHHGRAICSLGGSIRLLRLLPISHTTKRRSVEFHHFRCSYWRYIGGEGGT